MGELVELRDLIAAPGAVLPAEGAGANLGVLSRMFELDGERVVVRWQDLWTGVQSRTVARGDVAGVSVEPDDRSAAGERTCKVVVRLRGGETIVPVRRDRRDKGVFEVGVARLQRALGLASAAPPADVPAFIPTSLEDLPGTRYAAMAESGEGMRPIVDGPCTTLIATAGDENGDGGVRIRLGKGPPWLLVGADRERFWAHAVGMPAEWGGGNREVGMEWVRKRIFGVRDVPTAPDREDAGSTVWVQMRDGTRVRVAELLPRAEACAVVTALGRALELPADAPSRWLRGRTYLLERRAETLGPFGGVSGDGPVVATSSAAAAAAARNAGAASRRRPIVLPYSRERGDAIRIIRGDGVLRISVPPASFGREWIRRAVRLLGPAGLVGIIATSACVDGGGMSVAGAMGVVVPAVGSLWVAVAALLSVGGGIELLVADEVLRVERAGLLRRHKRAFRVEDVLDVGEGPPASLVTAVVRFAYGGPVTRRRVRLLTWEREADRRRVVEVLLAALGLDEDRGEAARSGPLQAGDSRG